MLYGMGASLLRLVPSDEMKVLPSPSSLSLAAARLGWPLQAVTVISVHGRPLELVHPHVHPLARLLVLSDSGKSPAALTALLVERGFGASTITVFEHLGCDSERRLDGRASSWAEGECAALNVVAVECRADAQAQMWSCLAGLPDEAFRHDGAERGPAGRLARTLGRRIEPRFRGPCRPAGWFRQLAHRHAGHHLGNVKSV